MKTGTKLGFAALVLAVGTTVLWFYMTGTVGLPGSRAGFVIAWLGAVALGIFAYIRGTSIVGALPPALGVLISGVLLFTVYISPQVLDTAKTIKVGDTIPHFTAPDGHGETFDSDSLHGQLVLIKFFRAHWCPYCVGELRRLEELRAEFDRRGVQVITVSTDWPEEIAADRHLHGLQARMLSDPQLVVTDAFGLRNTAFNSAPPSDDAEALPVPATLLLDRDGKLLWIDVSEDYQRRSDPSVVLAAMREHFDALPLHRSAHKSVE
tara:strand:+ start:4337 stop:5131 length:795 start_codon:yes stop_codon:yes gene_type:complete